MRRWRVVGLALIMGLVALTTLRAQRLPRPQIQAPRRDTTRRDTTGVDSAMAAKLRLSPPDSVMQALLRKSGYTVTRYEGDRVTFDAQNDLFQILGAASKRAIVQRGDSQTVYADTGVFFKGFSRERFLAFVHLLIDQLDAALRKVAVYPLNGSVGAVEQRGRWFGLSLRELEILELVCRGKTNLDIATALDISHFTVKNHVQRIFRKLDVSNRTGAAAKYNAALQAAKPKTE